MRQCLKPGFLWRFRRSAGQPALVNLAYGIIAGSVAEVTGGFIFSDDSAWDFERFPATAEDFLGFYFRPDQAIHRDNREWAERCLTSIPIDLKKRLSKKQSSGGNG